jgi:hypothetical protein
VRHISKGGPADPSLLTLLTPSGFYPVGIEVLSHTSQPS